MRTLHAAGVSQRAIVRQLEISLHVVRNFIQADQFPERGLRRPLASKLDPFLPYLRQQLAAGQDNALQLWRDLRDQQRYTDSRELVSQWVAHHRHLVPATTPDVPVTKRCGKPPVSSSEVPIHRPHILPARQAAWLLFHPPEDLDDTEITCCQRFCQHTATQQTTYTLVQAFTQMVRQRTADQFDAWLARSEATQIPELQTFVAGVRRDYATVKAALTFSESNGQVAGQAGVPRAHLKFIKRSMYGRAKFDLLRLRILAT